MRTRAEIITELHRLCSRWDTEMDMEDYHAAEITKFEIRMLEWVLGAKTDGSEELFGMNWI